MAPIWVDVSSRADFDTQGYHFPAIFFACLYELLVFTMFFEVPFFSCFVPMEMSAQSTSLFSACQTTLVHLVVLSLQLYGLEMDRVFGAQSPCLLEVGGQIGFPSRHFVRTAL